MFSSIVEGFLQRFCGRYLKNFGPQNVSVSVTGTITLTNVQIKTEELINFQLPYKPVRAFIGSLHLDLPLVMSTSFDLRLADVLIVVERNAENVAMDSATAHKAIQMWIGAFYFTLLHTESLKQNITSNELEYSQRLLDRLSISIQNVHLRVEDMFTAHVPCPIGRELMALGIIIGNLTFRPPTSAEIDDSNVWVYPSSPASLVINKSLELTELSVYCYREEPLGNISDEELNLELVRAHCYLRKAGTILGPTSLTARASATFNKASQIFGPVVLQAAVQGLDVRVSDEQIVFLCEFVTLFDRNVHVLQTRSRIGLRKITSAAPLAGPESRRRAKYHWSLIRDSIKIDWWKYASALKEGSIRWRAWFEVWRYVARYVALREVLLYHVGFEATDSGGDTISYSVNESLLLDHHSRAQKKAITDPGVESADSTSGNHSDRGTYQGMGAMAHSIIQAAEVLLEQQLRYDGDNVSPMSLSPSAVRALYALQLEMDATLSVRVTAQARLWAEEKYRLQRASSLDISHGDPDSFLDAALPTAQSVSLLVACVDACNLEGSFGMSRVEAQCSLTTSNSWDAVSTSDSVSSKAVTHGSTFVTETAGARVSPGTGTALVGWGDIFTLSCPQLPSADKSTSATEKSVRLECNAKGIFAPSFGRANIPLALLVPPTFNRDAMLSASESSPNGVAETPILTLHVPLQRSSTSFFGGSSDSSSVLTAAQVNQPDEKLPSVRIIAVVVAGTQNGYQLAFARLQEKVKEAIEARKTVVMRQQQLAERDDGEEDEAFVLDPSVLTVRDLQMQLTVPSINVCFSALYVSPAVVRAQYESQGQKLAHSVPVPLVATHIRGVSATVRANNNPWIVECQGSVDAVRVFIQPPTTSAQQEGEPRDKTSRKPPLPLFALPKVTVSAVLTQTSTMARTIAGGYDPSCFDIRATMESGFFKTTLHPETLSSLSGREASSSIWKSFRPLHHLWNRRAHWSRGTQNSTASTDGKMPPQSPAEASMRLGDAYTLHPKRNNVITEVFGNLRHKLDSALDKHLSHRSRAPSNPVIDILGIQPHPTHPSALQAALMARDLSGTTPASDIVLPEQTTSMVWATPSGALEIEVGILAQQDVMSLAAQIEKDEGWGDGGDDISVYDTALDDSSYEPQRKETSLGGAMVSGAGKATVVAATGIYNILTLGGILPSAIEAAAGQQSDQPKSESVLTQSRRRWMVEKAQLEARIKELEAQVAGRR